MKVFSTAVNINQALKNVGRVSEIVTVLSRHGFADLIHRMKLTKVIPSKLVASERFQERPLGVRLREAFQELGTTFVKLGQLLASRPDLIPDDVIAELEKLQDDVPSVPFSKLRPFLEEELKAPLDTLFDSFEENPIAAASVAQVHGAVLKGGRKVAVKVQRPGIDKVIQNDISILRALAFLLEKYVPESRTVNPTGLVEEFFKTILFETDFRVEANNIRRIRSNLAVMPKVSVPEVFTHVSTARILVLERFEGIRFSDREAVLARGLNPLDIVNTGADVFFHMVMHDGIFHGDLHAGNLFILGDGRIGLIDFGIVGRLSRRVRDSVVSMFIALMDEDYETLANEYLNLCQSSGETDLGALQKDLMDTIGPYVGMNLSEINVGKILLQSTGTAVKHNLTVPRELMLLFKAILTIEALGRRLEPNFDILSVGNRLAKQLITSRYRPERLANDMLVVGRDLQGLLETGPRLFRRFLKKWSQNQFAFEVKSQEVAQIRASIDRQSRVQMIGILVFGFLLLSLAMSFQYPEDRFLFLPVASWFFLGIAVSLSLTGLWVIKKGK